MNKVSIIHIVLDITRDNGDDFLLEGKKITIRRNRQFAKEMVLFGVGCMYFVWYRGLCVFL